MLAAVAAAATTPMMRLTLQCYLASELARRKRPDQGRQQETIGVVPDGSMADVTHSCHQWVVGTLGGRGMAMA